MVIGAAMNGSVSFLGSPIPHHWMFVREDGHSHSGAISESAGKYTAHPPPGGWPACCPKLHWIIENDLTSDNF